MYIIIKFFLCVTLIALPNITFLIRDLFSLIIADCLRIDFNCTIFRKEQRRCCKRFNHFEIDTIKRENFSIFNQIVMQKSAPPYKSLNVSHT